MIIKCLAVDSDLDIDGQYVAEWATRGIRMERADDMVEAMKKLQINEYVFVGINADAVDFMPLLNTMRNMTNTPILVATSDSNFSTEKEVASLTNGADLYARWHDSPEKNVNSVLAHISRKTARKGELSPVMFYKNMVISLAQRNAFISNTPLDLTRQEFDLLHYFMINEGNILTFEQIYRLIWGDEYDGSTYETIKGLVKRLRKKIGLADGEHINIQNRWAVGFTLPLNVE